MLRRRHTSRRGGLPFFIYFIITILGVEMGVELVKGNWKCLYFCVVLLYLMGVVSSQCNNTGAISLPTAQQHYLSAQKVTLAQ